MNLSSWHFLILNFKIYFLFLDCYLSEYINAFFMGIIKVCEHTTLSSLKLVSSMVTFSVYPPPFLQPQVETSLKPLRVVGCLFTFEMRELDTDEESFELRKVLPTCTTSV